MADAQLAVYNDAGIEQVSLGGINLALVQKVVINSMASWTAISGPLAAGLKYSFTVTAVSPVVAIATSVSGQNGAVFAVVLPAGAGQWTVSIYGGATEPTGAGGGTAGVSTLNAQVNVYVFDAAPAPVGSHGTGLVLFDPSGKCIFNSNYPGARVKQMLDDNNNLHGYGTSVTPPAGKTYAIVQRSNWGQQIIGSRNATTGDMLADEYRMGVSGGLLGATMQLGFGYPCFVNGAIAIPHGSPGAVGGIYVIFGCKLGSTYIGDGMVLDVTSF